eukprot:CAMPEP_0204439364 /NCGR_PEP_ID=MMETSP0470-20130426/81150_1 /ASSEMBLY_ACC=CAM_ASM_000385 /TAXON_ID=2969 /ORGANISM="Oxyrrhis marina" /LENGTH=137 /DNA_ID=CAMNT_0051438267 /DNA_START=40 /DNA_END=451 /DNA_ORIENTATION=-
MNSIDWSGWSCGSRPSFCRASKAAETAGEADTTHALALRGHRTPRTQPPPPQQPPRLRPPQSQRLPASRPEALRGPRATHHRATVGPVVKSCQRLAAARVLLKEGGSRPTGWRLGASPWYPGGRTTNHSLASATLTN